MIAQIHLNFIVLFILLLLGVALLGLIGADLPRGPLPPLPDEKEEE